MKEIENRPAKTKIAHAGIVKSNENLNVSPTSRTRTVPIRRWISSVLLNLKLPAGLDEYLAGRYS